MVYIELELGQLGEALDRQLILEELSAEHHTSQSSLLRFKPIRYQVEDKEVYFAFQNDLRHQVYE